MRYFISRYLCRTFLFILLGVLLNGCDEDNAPHFNGYVEGVYHYISSPVSGKLDTLYVHEGQWVLQNTPLFQLDITPESYVLKQNMATLDAAKWDLKNLNQPTKNTAQIAQLRAAINEISATLTYDQAELKRNLTLAETHQISQSNLDESIRNVAIDKAKLIQSQADLQAAKLSLGRQHEIKAQMATVYSYLQKVNQAKWRVAQKEGVAPVAGYVNNLFHRVGEQVNQYQTIVSIMSGDDVNAIFFVPEPSLSQLKLGQTVYVRCDGCADNIQATVSYIAANAEFTPPIIYSEKSRSKLVFKVEARLLHQRVSALHPGQPIEIYLKPTDPVNANG